MDRRVSSPRLVGRAAELDTFGKALGGARHPAGAILLVAGEAGIGKTRLVEQAADDARRGGVPVVRGGCLDLAAAMLPYAPFADIARSLLDGDELSEADRPEPAREALLRLAPERGGPRQRWPADAGQARLFAGIRDALVAASSAQPLLVIVEDIHWADTSTLDLIRYLAHNHHGSNIVLALTYRSDELGRRHPLRPFLADLERLPGTTRMELARLDRRELAEQLSGILDMDPGEGLVDRVFARSDGNPFFAEELLAADTPGSAIPTSLQEILGVRLTALPDTSQRVLRAAAAIGRVVGHGMLAHVTELSEPELVEALRIAVEHHILVPLADPPPRYAFRHALVREVAYDELLPPERVALHAVIADELREHPDLAIGGPTAADAEIAGHAWLALDTRGTLVASLGAARTAAAAFAFAEALGHLERALQVWDAVQDAEALTGTDRSNVLVEAARAASYTGRASRAATFAQGALAALPSGTDPRVRAEILAELFWYQFESSDLAGREATATEAERLVPDDPPSALRSRVLANLSTQRWLNSRHVEARRLARQAVEAARAAGARSEEGRALAVLAQALTMLGQTQPASEAFMAADTIFREIDDGDAAARSALWWAWNEEVAGRFSRCVEVAAEALESSARTGADARFGAGLRSVGAECLIEAGEWAAAEHLVRDIVDGARHDPAALWTNSSLARLAVYRGEPDEADRRIDAAATIPAIGVDRVFQLEDAILAAHAAGRNDEARRLADEAIAIVHDPTRDAELWWLLVTAIGGEADRAEAARLRRDQAEVSAAIEIGDGRAALLRQAAAIARAEGGTELLLEAYLATAAAEVSRLHGSSDPDLWATAARLRAALPQPREAAQARLYEAAARLAQGGQRPQAVDALRAAHAEALRLGATPLRDSAIDLARRARIDLPDRPPAGAANGVATTGVTDGGVTVAVTEREREVLALVADGHTNREIAERLFISPKTASVHVSHAMDKLGARSRYEAAAIASRAGLLGGRGEGDGSRSGGS